MTTHRHPHLDHLAIAAVAGAVAGFAASAVFGTVHPALVVTSDAATSIGVLAALGGRLDHVLVRLVAAVDIAVLAMTYARELGPVTSACLLLATVLIAVPHGPHLDG